MQKCCRSASDDLIVAAERGLDLMQKRHRKSTCTILVDVLMHDDAQRLPDQLNDDRRR